MSNQQFILQAGMKINLRGEVATVKAIGENFCVIEYSNGEMAYPLPSELMLAYRSGLLIIKKKENALLINKQLTNQEDKEKAIRVEHYLVELHQHANPHSLKTRKKAKDIVKKRHGYTGKDVPSESTLRRWYVSWIQNEMEIYSVIKRAKKTRASRHSEAVVELAESIIDEYYLIPQGLNKRQTYFKFKEHYDELIAANEIEGRSISESRFYELLNELNQLDVVYARYGKDEARKFARCSEGMYVLDFPLQRVEIDAVHLKIGLLDDETGEFLGTAIVYLAIDTYTRCIVGYSVSVGNKPSEISDAVIELIKHCVTPKIKSVFAQNNWPLTGIPFAFVGDAGKAFKCRVVTNLMAQLKCTHITTETKSPWRKGMIEAYNRGFRSMYASNLPGYTRNNDEDKTDKTIEEIATLTLGEFISTLEIYILDHYHQNPHKGLFLDTPANVCEEALKECSPRIVADLKKLEVFSGVELEGVIQGCQGIQRNTLYYNSRQLNDLRLAITLHGDKKNPKVPFLYDKNDVSKISVIDETTGVLFEVPCCDPRVLPGMSLAEFNRQYRSGSRTNTTNVFTKSNWVVSEAIKRKQEEIMLKKKEKAALAKKMREEKKEQKNKQAKNKASQPSDITERATEHVQQEANRHARNHTDKTVQKNDGRPTNRPVTRPVTK
ncbi:transposase family protein [Colwellia demingiae]|uniref:Transposase family protein n=1 Tax=Colwellia demingiae TaxID=89401 RepID=A0A5C6QI41_9GAMM|nr:DDE-type integrase/transposase/recombinase [Colwellia demingiae]TWX68521.1 transposase family protein [Colwellia demingiae]